MWGFIAKVLGYAWKYGVRGVNAVVGWVRTHWSTVQRWLNAGLSVTSIIEIIIRILF